MQDRKYYVVFTPPTSSWFGSRFLNRRIGHCSLIIVDGPDAVYLDRLIYRLEALHFRDNSFEDLFSLINHKIPDSLALQVEPLPNPENKARYYLSPFSCVTLVKATLGITTPWVLTPYQLYQYLLKFPSTKEVTAHGRWLHPLQCSQS